MQYFSIAAAIHKQQHDDTCLLVSPVQEPNSIEKVAEIDEHIGCAMSGLTADAKTLVDHARADTQVGPGHARSIVVLLYHFATHG